MEKMLLKMARQLNAMDEASLMALWNKYLTRVQNFDASREWDEAFIVLSLIQAVRGKNQLFNTKWEEREALRLTPPVETVDDDDMDAWMRFAPLSVIQKKKEASRPKAIVHQFRPRS